jgi:hypothetical protein
MASFEIEPESAKLRTKIKKVQIVPDVHVRSDKKILSSKQDQRTRSVTAATDLTLIQTKINLS